MPLDQAVISPMDRGFLFGDGVYEVMARVDGQVRAKSLHEKRLAASLESIQLTVSVEQIFNDIDRLIAKANLESAKIYVQVTRGAPAVRDHAFPVDVAPTVFLTINEFDVMTYEACKAIVRPDIRWRRNSIKSVSLLSNVLLMQEATVSGAQEAILFREAYVTEASTSNVFLIQGNTVVTPPLSDSILPGITRHLVLEMAEALGIKATEKNVRVDSLADADGIFVSSSTRGLMPINELSPGGTINHGLLTETFLALQSAYDERLRHHD